MVKKVESPPPKKLLGRMSTSVSFGLVGCPNVGKSTIFNALTNSSVKAEGFAFCTIDPHLAQCQVNDERFDWLVEQYKPTSAVKAHLNIYDIAGLVRGASEGSRVRQRLFVPHWCRRRYLPFSPCLRRPHCTPERGRS
ncbi:hypothetical protein GEMRC1_003556 [Eukaryota sp. GEM-RC1]